MQIRHELKRALHRAGYEVKRTTATSSPAARLKTLLARYEIDTVLDIGANTGQFALHLRNEVGFARRIVSFEPLGDAYRVLATLAAADPGWQTLNYALGDVETTAEMNVAANSLSSSVLAMLPAHLHSAPQSKFVAKESIRIKRLDSVFPELCPVAQNVFMKIDTQGFEIRVLRGAVGSLAHINTVQLEMSLIPLYDGELVFTELIGWMAAQGYTLIGLEHGFTDAESGELLQVDGIFRRTKRP